MPAAVNSAFDVAYWLSDVALNANQCLQPQKLQRLMFLAQAYYAVVNGGRKLMPAAFVADDAGPIEPNVYAALARGRPPLDTDLFLPTEAEDVLKGVWKKFGHKGIEALDQMTKETAAYREARERGPRAEIEHTAIWWSFACADRTPGAEQVVRPTVLRTQTGRPVVVQRWAPAAKAVTPAGPATEPPGDTQEP